MAPHSCKDCLRGRTMAEQANPGGSMANGHGVVNGTSSTPPPDSDPQDIRCKLG